MPSVRMAYRDEEGDYVDLTEKSFSRFVRNNCEQKDITILNIRVSEACSPAVISKHSSESHTAENRPCSSRKGLDFRPSTEETTDTTPTDTTEDLTGAFRYRSPLEYSIDTLKDEVQELEAQVESAKEHLDNLTSKYVNQALNKGRGKQFSNCHLRLDHNMRQCTIDKCMTSEQCADVSKHPEEKQIIDAASDQLKKLERDLKAKISEYDTRLKGMQSARASFPQQIRRPLINSNKAKYLMKTSDGMFVPRSALVNMNIAKLDRYFKGKVPGDVERIAKTFKYIIDDFDKVKDMPKPCQNRNPAKTSLETNNVFQVKFPKPSATVSSVRDSVDVQETRNQKASAPLTFPNVPATSLMPGF